MGATKSPQGPDFEAGIDVSLLADGATLSGHVGGEAVLLSRRGQSYFAVSGACSHYGALLSEGVIEGDHAHCPLHHACFNLRTGEAVTAPAFAPLRRWHVDVEQGILRVRRTLPPASKTPPAAHADVRQILIIGGGAAGFSAAEMLRRRGFDGALTMLSSDTAPPCDRPNLSKDYLAGKAQEDWIPLRDDAFYREQQIDLRLGTAAFEINTQRRRVMAASGEIFSYDRLLLATGANAATLPGFSGDRVHTLRTLADTDAILESAKRAKRAVIVGSGFIGLEVAASLRQRGLDVHVVAPDPAPMIRLLGREVAQFIRGVHEQHGVHFHLGRNARQFDGRRVMLDGIGSLDADLVIVAVGARPNAALAARSGLKVSNGVEVDAYLRTSDANIFAAGDVALYPDTASGHARRIEHWVTAQRQGQTAAINMLGGREAFRATPFFWSEHFEHSLHYVGYAREWTRVELDGDPKSGNFAARYLHEGRCVAAAFVGRPRDAITLRLRLDAALGVAPCAS